MTYKHQFERFIQTIQLLAADYDTQIRLFPDFVQIPDEIILTYDDSMALVDKVLHGDLLKESQISKLSHIKQAVDELDSEVDLWTLDALKHSHVWEEIRTAARDFLESIGEKRQIPKLDWLTYIEGNSQK